VRLAVILAFGLLCAGVASAAENNYDTLVKSARAFERVHSLHMHREGGTPTDVDYVAPDRYRVTYGSTEIIWIGKTQYIRGEGGQWTSEITGNEPPFERSVIEDAIGALQKADIKDLGDAKLGNIMTRRYEITTPEKAVATVWIGQSDGLTYRIENRKADGTFDSAYVYSQFNAPIKIDPPPGVSSPAPMPSSTFPK
jgi:hypothetical protein